MKLEVLKYLPAAICFAGAAYLLINNIDTGWGWLIVAGIIVSDQD
jgi:hypothetical protein